jgi:O-succinylbenzoate synthase
VIRLAGIALREIRLPLKDPFRTAGGVVDNRRIVLLELHDSDGISTWSECVAEELPGYSTETPDTCWSAIADHIAPIVLGQSFSSPDMVDEVLERELPRGPMACAAVAMGMWALDATRREMSLASFLHESSASHEEGRAPRSMVETGIALGMQASPEALFARCATAVREGYCRIKIKIAPGKDIDYAKAARDAVGSRAALSVDGNRSYSLENSDDIRKLESLDELGLSMIEEPANTGLQQYAQLQQRLTTPICLDESITGSAAATEMIALQSARVVNIKPGRVGGFGQSIAIHDICADAEIPVWCGGMLESGIGRAYNVALAALPNFTLPGDLSPSDRYWADDVITTPWTMDENGRVQVPLSQAGIGVDVNMALIENLTVRRLKLEPR